MYVQLTFINQPLSQSNEVSSTNHMEKEGLHRVLNFTKERGLNVGVLVTDRHQQITKMMREQHPDIKHYFDVWHVAKGECIDNMTCGFGVFATCLLTCMVL